MKNTEIIKRLEAIKESDPEAVDAAIFKISLLDKTIEELSEWVINKLNKTK